METDEAKSTIKRRQLSPNSGNSNKCEQALREGVRLEMPGRLPGGGKF